MATKSETIRVRIEPEIKQQAEAILETIGMSPSDAIGLFYRQVAWQQGIPLALKVPNKVTQKALRDTQARKGLQRVIPFCNQHDAKWQARLRAAPDGA